MEISWYFSLKDLETQGFEFGSAPNLSLPSARNQRTRRTKVDGT